MSSDRGDGGVIIIHTMEKVKNISLAVWPIKLFDLMINLVSQFFFT